MVEVNVEELLAQLTLDEKLSLLAGGSTWRTAPIKRLGVPKLKAGSDQSGIFDKQNAEGLHAIDNLYRYRTVLQAHGVRYSATMFPLLLFHLASAWEQHGILSCSAESESFWLWRYRLPPRLQFDIPSRY